MTITANKSLIDIDGGACKTLQSFASLYRLNLRVMNIDYKILMTMETRKTEVPKLNKKDLFKPKITFKRTCTKHEITKPSRAEVLPKLAVASDIKTVLDVDPDFYKMVSGRPIKSAFSIRQYKEDLRKICRQRLCSGYVKDEIISIDRAMKKESKKYAKTLSDFEEYKHGFDQYLAHDHNKTMEVVNKCSETSKILADKSEDNRQSQRDVALLRSQIRCAEEKLNNLIFVGKFFFGISPISWKNKHAYIKEINCTDEFVELPSSFLDPIDVDKNVNVLQNLPVPKLYFTQPGLLVDVFEAIENQNLNYAMGREFSRVKIERLFSKINDINSFWNEEIKQSKEQVDQILHIIELEEERNTELESTFHDFINRTFRYLISSKPVLNLKNDVTFVFQNTVMDNDLNLSLKDAVTILEKEHEALCLEMDRFDVDIIKSVQKEVFQEDFARMRDARKACADLKNYERIKKALKAAYEEPRMQKKF